MRHKLPRRFMRAQLVPQSFVPALGLRAPADIDIEGLASLLLDAYRGTIDQEEQTLDEALAEVHKTYGGTYGEFLSDSSRIIVQDETIVSAALITRYQGLPFLAFSLTRPDYQRRNLARTCLVSAMEDLRIRGESCLRLRVTLANTPARTLYESLGFLLEEE